jgi:hypothetical protein
MYAKIRIRTIATGRALYLAQAIGKSIEDEKRLDRRAKGQRGNSK